MSTKNTVLTTKEIEAVEAVRANRGKPKKEIAKLIGLKPPALGTRLQSARAKGVRDV